MNGTDQFDFRPWHCPVCGPGEEAELGMRGGAFHRFGLGVACRIVRCRTCGLLYANPFPIPRNPQELYGDPEAYFSGHNLEGKWAAIRTWVKKLKEEHGTELRILDVGSGQGELVAGAREAGFHAEGLEFSEAMIQSAKSKYGIELHRISIEEAAERWPGSYDVVSLCAVLEHVQNPDSMIAAAARLLRPNGMLFLDIPNEPNLLTILGNFANHLRGSRAVLNLSPTWTPFHIYGFNRGALERVLGKHGFEVRSVWNWANPVIKPGPGWKSRLIAWAATFINQVANWIGMASNLHVWARKR